MKSILKLTLTLAAATTFCSTVFGQGVVTTNGLLKVNGNKIENKSGNTYSVAGNSMFWSGFQNDGGKFYTKEVVDHLVTDWKSGVIRAAMAVEEADGASVKPNDSRFPGALERNPSGEGYYNNPEKEYAKIKTVIDAAIANDVYVIVDFHSHFADEFLDDAKTFFTQIARDYGNNEHIIYEIFNEPIGLARNRFGGADGQGSNASTQTRTWNEIIRPYAVELIKTIRAIDPDNMIIVGTPFFSQGVDIASQNPITANDVNLTGNQILNVSYTLHFYAAQIEHPALRNKATTALNNGIALFVTEWGTVAASGDGSVNLSETQTWMRFMKENGISHANWAIGDKAEGASAIKGGFGINGLLQNSLTDSGKLVRCITENWNSDFSNCNINSGGGFGGGGNSNIVFPKGVGIKLNNGDFVPPNVESEVVNESLVYTIEPTEFVSYSLRSFENFDDSKSYTVQLVVSSETNGNSLRLATNEGMDVLGSAIVPNTGKDKFQLVNVEGVKFLRSATNDLPFSVSHQASGNGFKIESIYIIQDGDPTLSVDDFDPIFNEVNLYPNPAVNNVKLSLDGKDATYKVFDITGKEVIKTAEYKGNIAVNNLTSGLYLLQLTIDDKVKTYKFVKE